MNVVDTVILAGWAVFWIYWLVAAVGAKSGKTRWGQFAGSRIAIILIALLLVHSKFFMGQHGLTHSALLEGIGLAIWILGLALAVWARVYIGQNWGMPMTRKADPELVTTGPYHTIRHPIYTGNIVALAGTTVAVGIYFLVAVILGGAYFTYSAVVEERDMAKQFPATYPEYKQSTKMLIPFVF